MSQRSDSPFEERSTVDGEEEVDYAPAAKRARYGGGNDSNTGSINADDATAASTSTSSSYDTAAGCTSYGSDVAVNATDAFSING